MGHVMGAAGAMSTGEMTGGAGSDNACTSGRQKGEGRGGHLDATRHHLEVEIAQAEALRTGDSGVQGMNLMPLSREADSN